VGPCPCRTSGSRPKKSPENEHITCADAVIRKMALSSRRLTQGTTPAIRSGQGLGIEIRVQVTGLLGLDPAPCQLGHEFWDFAGQIAKPGRRWHPSGNRERHWTAIDNGAWHSASRRIEALPGKDQFHATPTEFHRQEPEN